MDETIPSDPPVAIRVTGVVAALSCGAGCAMPGLVAAGILTGAGAAIAPRTLLAVAATLAAAALGIWWLHRRRPARRAAVVAGVAARDGCDGNRVC